MSKSTKYTEQNNELFHRRGELLDEIHQLEGRTQLDRSQKSRLQRMKSDLDMITFQIMELNHGLVLSYVKKFTGGSSQNMDDFIAAGQVGLIQAINSYSPQGGSSFSRWAYQSIKREVLMAVRRTDFSTIGYADFERRPAILAAFHALELQDPDSRPEVEEVAAKAHVTVAQASRVLNPPRTSSLDVLVGDSETAPLIESIPDDTPAVEDDVLQRLNTANLARFAEQVLKPRELFVLVRRFGLDGEPTQTLASIGAELGLSRESVRNVQSNALAKLTHPSVRGQLLSHLDVSTA